jgi:hypothetical protein
MKKITGFFVLSSLLVSGLFAGGPWTKAKGKYYVKLSEWWTVFDEHFTDTGLRDPNITTGIFSTFLYAEYGISDRFTGIYNGAIFSRNYMNNLRSLTTNEILIPGEGVNSLGDMDFALKYRLNKQDAKVPLALSVVLGVRTGAVGRGEQGNLQTGDGEFNQMLQLDAGRGFKVKKLPAYVSGFVAFNHRTEGFSEEVRFGLELGLGLLDEKLWINSKFNAIESLKNGLVSSQANSTSIFANNTEFMSISLEANYLLTKKLGLSASAAEAVRGEIIPAAPAYSLGLFINVD